jgi:hypothetical protein
MEQLPFLGALPRFDPGCTDSVEVEHFGRTVIIAACASKAVRHPTLLWTLFGSDDSNPWDAPYILRYVAVATAVERLLPDCVLIKPDARRKGYTVKRYWMQQESEVEDGWTVGWFETSTQPSMPTGLFELLGTVDDDWQLRLAPPWVILVGPEEERNSRFVRSAAMALADWAAGY